MIFPNPCDLTSAFASCPDGRPVACAHLRRGKAIGWRHWL